MTGIESIFLDLGLSQYLHVFEQHGFDTWDTILDITESDLDALGVKLGHRRKLQRRIAHARGLSSDQALISPVRNTLIDDRQSEDQNGALSKSDNRDGGQGNGKRKYRRHPKPDETAPERPPSAYVIFSNKMRADLKGRNLSFTEIAKLVGENWQNLSPSEKEPYEAEAFRAKEKYNSELARYKRTEEYKKYAEYLVEFKEKHANVHNATDPAKRPRLDHQASTGSSAAGSSADSQHGTDGALMSGKGGIGGGVRASPASPAAFRLSFGGSSPSKSFATTGTACQDATVKSTEKCSPPATTSTVLPGYRDYLVGTQQQKMAWRGGAPALEASSSPLKSSPASGPSERRSQPPARGNPDHSLQFGVRSQNGYRTGSSFSPPALLTSESTASTTMSSASNSSLHAVPRTPLESSLERQLPIAPLYVSKPPDNQLPPIRSVSLSPQLSTNLSYNSPSGEPGRFALGMLASAAGPTVSIPTSYPGLTSTAGVSAMDVAPAPGPRGYVSAAQTPMGLEAITDNVGRALPHHGTDEVLDPVSALLKADEMVNRAGRDRQLA